MRRRTLPGVCRLTPLIAAGLFVGCGDQWAAGRPQPVPVSGTIFHEDRPVEGAAVIFAPTGHSYAAAGRTDAEGRFTLQTFDPDDGAVPGEYTVTVRKVETSSQAGADPSGDAPQPAAKELWLLPAKYADASSSGLTATVPDGGAEDLVFKLTGAPGAPKQPARAPAVSSGE